MIALTLISQLIKREHQTYNPPFKPIATTSSCETPTHLDELDDQMETIAKETRELQRKVNNKLLIRSEAVSKT